MPRLGIRPHQAKSQIHSPLPPAPAIAPLQVTAASVHPPEAVGGHAHAIPQQLTWMAKQVLSRPAHMSHSGNTTWMHLLEAGHRGPHTAFLVPVLSSASALAVRLVGHLHDILFWPSSAGDSGLVNESSWTGSFRSWLLMETGFCEIFTESPCQSELLAMLAVFFILLFCVALVSYLLCIMREEVDINITPLSPQLIVKTTDLRVSIPWSFKTPVAEIKDTDGNLICKVVSEFPDNPTTAVTATLQLENSSGFTLAILMALSVAPVGQTLALFRVGRETFGFVVPDGEDRYAVQHRSGTRLLTLLGDFSSGKVEVLNPLDIRVCYLEKADGVLMAHLEQGVDAGLVISSYLATQVHRRTVGLEASTSTSSDSPQSLSLAAGEASPDPNAAESEAADMTGACR
mmetsp:Transcript_20078/g.46786  ORF Transcript_20078/g.46786 Transcript_20078/m.46786 type:complete len:402 (+) Transcript_20078:115-1320(+)